VVGRQNADIADTPPKGHCHGNHFWLSIYGVHIGVTWRIRLNRPCAAARCGFISNYFDHLLVITCTHHYHLTNCYCLPRDSASVAGGEGRCPFQCPLW